MFHALGWVNWILSTQQQNPADVTPKPKGWSQIHPGLLSKQPPKATVLQYDTIHLPSNDSEFTGTHNVGYSHETVCAKSSHLSGHGCSMCRTCVMLMNRTASKAGLSALQLVSKNPSCNGLAFATGETRWTKSHLMHYHVNGKIHQICAYAKSRANVLFLFMAIVLAVLCSCYLNC